MKELIKEAFALWVRNLWVKEIHKVMKKRDKAFEEYQRHQYVVGEMYKEFCKRYPDAAENGKRRNDESIICAEEMVGDIDG